MGWNATIGNGIYAIHLSPTLWGWNARAASDDYLAVEFAQPTVAYTITDEQVRAFRAWFKEIGQVWPDLKLPGNMPTHAELPEGQADGKSDCYPVGDQRADDLRRRILEAL